MSTGLLDRRKVADQWDEDAFAQTFKDEGEAQSAEGTGKGLQRPVLTLIDNALDQAVEQGMDWSQRQAVDAALAKGRVRSAVATASRENALSLIAQWETDTARYGSIAASKESESYRRLLTSVDEDALIRASLRRLTEAPSPHVLSLLRDIAGATPAADETTIAGASQAWVRWGAKQGLI